MCPNWLDVDETYESQRSSYSSTAARSDRVNWLPSVGAFVIVVTAIAYLTWSGVMG